MGLAAGAVRTIGHEVQRHAAASGRDNPGRTLPIGELLPQDGRAMPRRRG